MEMSLRPPANTGQTRLLRPRRPDKTPDFKALPRSFQTTNHWMGQRAEASGPVGMSTRNCSEPALSPEEGKTGRGGREKSPSLLGFPAPALLALPWKPLLPQYNPQKPEHLKSFLSPKGTLLE